MKKFFGQKLRLMFFYCVCAILPILIIFSYFYQDIYNLMEKELLSAARHSLVRIADNINKDINQVLDLSNRIYGNKTIYDLLEKQYNSPIQYFDDYRQTILPTLKALSPVDTKINYYCVYVDNPSIFSGGFVQRLDMSALNSDWLSDDYEISESFSYFYGRYYPHLQNGMLFSFIRNMNPYKNSGQFNKIIKIDLEPDFFLKTVEGRDFNGIIYIVDADETIIYSTNHELEWMRYESDKNEEKYRQEISVSTLGGWRVIGVSDVDYIRDSLNTKRNIAVILLMVSVIFMVGVVYRLVNTIYTSRLRETQIVLQKKQAELNALRNQVDPHFLFNILETVRMKLLLSGQKNHSTVIMRMAKLYRKLLMWEDDIVSLSEEAEFIREFMFIQEYRYDEALVWTMEMDDSAKDFKVPKMLLHSFIENACKHGMNENGGESVIGIVINMQEDSLYFKVTDNGSGFPPEEVRNFYTKLDGREERSDGIGINNAIARLRLYYGDRFKLSLDTKEGQGTIIEIILPQMG